MSTYSKVIWSEGLFLQPQHFQQHERYLENLIQMKPDLTGFQRWGVFDLEFNSHLFSIGKLALSRCRGVLPDGTGFDIPHNDPPPPSIDIPNGLTNTLVYLCLAIQQPGQTDVGSKVCESKSNQKFYRFYDQHCEVLDSNAEMSSATPIQVGRFSFQLRLGDENIGGFSALPIAKIKESFFGTPPVVDESFIPSCLDIHAIPRLSSFINELLSLLHQRGEALSSSLMDTGRGNAPEIADLMLLQLVNRSESLVRLLSLKDKVHPEYLYLQLVQLLSELAVFTAQNRRPSTLPKYQHNDLQSCYDPLIQGLRNALSTVLEKKAISLNLEARKFGIWASLISDRTLLHTAQFILAVRANMPIHTLANQFPAQTKISAVETIQSLINRGLPGIELLPMETIPPEIPYHPELSYFALSKEQIYWEELSNSAAIAIHIGNYFPGLDLQLWAVRSRTF